MLSKVRKDKNVHANGQHMNQHVKHFNLKRISLTNINEKHQTKKLIGILQSAL